MAVIPSICEGSFCESGMARKAKTTFDPKIFLATVNHGRTVSTYPREAVVFRQSGPADAVFYVRKGRVKIMLVPHTLTHTTIGEKQTGDLVNLEPDLLAKYAEKLHG